MSKTPAPATCPRARRRALLASLLAIVMASEPWFCCRAQSATGVADYKVKAAFLYKFASYVAWPTQVFDGPESPLVIGVVGSDALTDELAEVVAERTVDGRAVNVRRLARGQSLSGIHILFIGQSDAARSSELLASAKGHPVLTVTESNDAFPQGSIINFVIVDDRLRFDVALREAELVNLKLSARLLAVARKVITGPS
jgi:hypothetical protein